MIDFIEAYPPIWEAHEHTGSLCHESGPLDAKTCHLIQAGAAASSQLRGSMRSHISQAVDAGATREEVFHMVLLLLNTVGFPNMMMAFGWAYDMLERMEA